MIAKALFIIKCHGKIPKQRKESRQERTNLIICLVV